MYAAVFGLPQDGEKITLLLMGVSAAGYTTTKQAVNGFASNADAASDTSPLTLAQ